MTLKLGLEIPYSEVQDREGMIALAQAAEANGFHSIWVSELYSYDAFTTLTQLALATTTIKVGTNIANIFARTPAMLAGTSASLDQMTGGRFILGIGVSGPQVIEGWHGLSYDRPLQRTRETIDIVRTIVRGDRLNYDGQVYKVTQGLKLLNKGQRPDMPIYVAAIGPKNVALTAEMADGWLPTFFSAERAQEVFWPHVTAGLAKAGGAKSFEVMPFVAAATGDLETSMNMARIVAGFYIGGMGSREKNFYNELVKRYGYVKEAKEIQDLFLGGDKAGAIARVPDALVDEVSIVGDQARITDRMKAFEAAGATGAVIGPMAADLKGRIELIETLARANA